MFGYNLNFLDVPVHALAPPGQVSSLDATTGLSSHLALAKDLSASASGGMNAPGFFMLIELLDHDLVRNLFLAKGPRETDSLLRSIARRILGVLPAQHRIYYVGVARFVVVAQTPNADAPRLAREIKQSLAMPITAVDVDIHFDVVIAVLALSEALAQPDDALRKATVALKRATLDRLPLMHYAADFDRELVRRFRLLQDLPRALHSGQFHVAYQPRLDLTDLTVGAEALIRWNHPDFGPVSPAEFVPLANQTPLMADINLWVLQTTLQQRVQFERWGPLGKLSVNFSPGNLSDPHFADAVLDCAWRSGAQLDGIQVECTEYAALSSPETVHCIAQLRRAGISVALDDFGSGYSNIAAISDLAIDVIKIDRSLTAKVENESFSLKVLVSLILFVKSLGFKVTAEGVETPSTLALLKKLKIDEAQGYLIAKPLNADHFCEFLAHPPPLDRLMGSTA